MFMTTGLPYSVEMYSILWDVRTNTKIFLYWPAKQVHLRSDIMTRATSAI